ncbi:carboxymuconolactone decarboxylase family protein [Gracilibacillus kekensis]|uniref:Alkylhydroperoxidase AhpD family core domain-containing protein n=1 Tax=Gracilibacillus kekensis TaxID=1027249 RepID=A0A1M7NMC9_9BACI|nr:carboxymuconolactone decarboxylase family protein [Gracilibacillus kekensis]SHN05141.1 alkylhydroperoxidase AhpD family core domain-containing protein [Gracilibacillus kekensis]
MSRINYGKVAPNAVKLLMKLEEYKKEAGIQEELIHLCKIKASQLNKCAFCINMHTQEALKAGETEQRIYCLQAWQETSIYSDKEKAVLALTEAVTLISVDGVPDKVYEDVRVYFDEKETIDLIMIIITINSWNRLSIANRNIVSR